MTLCWREGKDEKWRSEEREEGLTSRRIHAQENITEALKPLSWWGRGGILRPEDGPLLALLLFCVENSPVIIQMAQGLLQ